MVRGVDVDKTCQRIFRRVLFVFLLMDTSKVSKARETLSVINWPSRDGEGLFILSVHCTYAYVDVLGISEIHLNTKINTSNCNVHQM